VSQGRHLRKQAARPPTGGSHVRRPKHVSTDHGRRRRYRGPMFLFVCAFVFASGTAALAFSTTSVSGTGRAQAVTLATPGAGSASNPGATSVSLSWGASSGLPAHAGYLVLRSTSSGGPYAKVGSGGCAQSTTLLSTATSCRDTGLDAGTTYYYEVEAGFYDVSALWVSAPTAQFSATTSAQGITSADDATFAAGSAGTFTVTTAGFSSPTLSDAAFTGCTPSALPGTLTFTDDHDGTATLAGTPSATSAGSYTVCIEATDASGVATQTFTLRVSQAPAGSGAPTITSASSTSFFVGAASSFQTTASASPAPSFSNAAFAGCTPSALPSGITLASNGLLSGVPGADAVGSYTVCLNATDSTGASSTQTFTLTIDTEALVISSPAVSGAGSSTPNLGPITVRRQTGSGSSITTGGALTVHLTSSSPNGASFGTTQFASAPVTSVTIPSGQSSATFWFGSATTGTPTVAASAPNYVSGTQQETITTSPAGLGIALAPGTAGGPVVKCGVVTASDTCTVTGVGAGQSVALVVTFWDSNQGPVVYSASQASTIDETGQSTGTVTIRANASNSSPGTVTSSIGNSTLTFGPFTLTIGVSS
jgi:hypothetical protein